jgi:hypothetical protein
LQIELTRLRREIEEERQQPRPDHTGSRSRHAEQQNSRNKRRSYSKSRRDSDEMDYRNDARGKEGNYSDEEAQQRGKKKSRSCSKNHVVSPEASRLSHTQAAPRQHNVHHSVSDPVKNLDWLHARAVPRRHDNEDDVSVESRARAATRGQGDHSFKNSAHGVSKTSSYGHKDPESRKKPPPAAMHRVDDCKPEAMKDDDFPAFFARWRILHWRRRRRS